MMFHPARKLCSMSFFTKLQSLSSLAAENTKICTGHPRCDLSDGFPSIQSMILGTRHRGTEAQSENNEYYRTRGESRSSLACYVHFHSARRPKHLSPALYLAMAHRRCSTLVLFNWLYSDASTASELSNRTTHTAALLHVLVFNLTRTWTLGRSPIAAYIPKTSFGNECTSLSLLS